MCSMFANHILVEVDHPSRVGAVGRFHDEHAKNLNHQGYEVSRWLLVSAVSFVVLPEFDAAAKLSEN